MFYCGGIVPLDQLMGIRLVNGRRKGGTYADVFPPNLLRHQAVSLFLYVWVV
jgi:hypothetical protein